MYLTFHGGLGVCPPMGAQASEQLQRQKFVIRSVELEGTPLGGFRHRKGAPNTRHSDDDALVVSCFWWWLLREEERSCMSQWRFFWLLGGKVFRRHFWDFFARKFLKENFFVKSFFGGKVFTSNLLEVKMQRYLNCRNQKERERRLGARLSMRRSVDFFWLLVEKYLVHRNRYI